VAGGAPVLPPPVTGLEAAAFPYLIGGGRATGATTKLRVGAPAEARRSSSPAAAAAVATATKQARRRRHRNQLVDPGNRYEYLDHDHDHDHDTATGTSASGAGPMGFPGTVRQESGPAVTGLTSLADDAAGSGPRVPMLPHTWDAPPD